MSDEPPVLLLDTHVWIWLVNGDPRANVVEWPNGRLWLPAIAVWEVGLLVAKGRLKLVPDVRQWVGDSLQNPQMALLPLDPEIALLANSLPGSFHGDPADRLIVASALHTGTRLATSDRKILLYAAIHQMPVLSFARR